MYMIFIIDDQCDCQTFRNLTTHAGLADIQNLINGKGPIEKSKYNKAKNEPRYIYIYIHRYISIYIYM